MKNRFRSGLVHDRKEITQQISKMSDSDDVDKVKDQLKKLTNVNDEMEKTQDIIRDKVDKQIPKDVSSCFAFNQILLPSVALNNRN